MPSGPCSGKVGGPDPSALSVPSWQHCPLTGHSEEPGAVEPFVTVGLGGGEGWIAWVTLATAGGSGAL